MIEINLEWTNKENKFEARKHVKTSLNDKYLKYSIYFLLYICSTSGYTYNCQTIWEEQILSFKIYF